MQCRGGKQQFCAAMHVQLHWDDYYRSWMHLLFAVYGTMGFYFFRNPSISCFAHINILHFNLKTALKNNKTKLFTKWSNLCFYTTQKAPTDLGCKKSVSLHIDSTVHTSFGIETQEYTYTRNNGLFFNVSIGYHCYYIHKISRAKGKKREHHLLQQKLLMQAAMSCLTKQAWAWQLPLLLSF